MLKNILSLGTALNKKEQQSINGISILNKNELKLIYGKHDDDGIWSGYGCHADDQCGRNEYCSGCGLCESVWGEDDGSCN